MEASQSVPAMRVPASSGASAIKSSAGARMPTRSPLAVADRMLSAPRRIEQGAVAPPSYSVRVAPAAHSDAPSGQVRVGAPRGPAVRAGDRLVSSRESRPRICSSVRPPGRSNAWRFDRKIHDRRFEPDFGGSAVDDQIHSPVQVLAAHGRPGRAWPRKAVGARRGDGHTGHLHQRARDAMRRARARRRCPAPPSPRRESPAGFGRIIVSGPAQNASPSLRAAIGTCAGA